MSNVFMIPAEFTRQITNQQISFHSPQPQKNIQLGLGPRSTSCNLWATTKKSAKACVVVEEFGSVLWMGRIVQNLTEQCMTVVTKFQIIQYLCGHSCFGY